MRVWDNIAGLTGPIRAYETPFIADVRLLAEAVARRGGPALYVARDDRHALMAFSAARFFRPDLDVVSLPAWDCLPYDRVSPSPAVAAQRCSALARLASVRSAPLLVVTTASALIQRVPPREHMAQASFVARVGDTVAIEQVNAYLQINGYGRASTVREPGEFSIRGGIVDIFPAGTVEPVRLDFFGDQLEVARYFDPETQRSTVPLKEVVLAPVSEIAFSDAALSRLRENFISAFGVPGGDPMYEAARERIRRQGVEQWLPLFYDRLETLFDYLGPKALVGFDGPAEHAAIERIGQALEYYEVRKSGGAAGRTVLHVLPPERLYLSPHELEASIAAHSTVRFSSQDAPEKTDGIYGRAKPGRQFVAERANPSTNLFDAVVRFLRERQAAGKKVIIAAWSAGSASRLESFLQDHGVERARLVRSWKEAVAADISIAELAVDTGFEDDDLVLVSEQDILGDKLARPRKRKSSAAVIAEAAALSAGDLIVHVEHGVGRYEGLRTVEVNDAPHDCLELVYAGGDKILLPVENVELITRYGSESGENALDRLGGSAWQSRKARAKRKIMDMAEDLIRLAAERELKRAPRTDGADGVFREFCARFPYEETDDQLSAIEDVVKDLTSGKPMDRLICGDVGFGKTEVALRAAFLVAMSGLQVAIIAPTTLLSRQHFGTFSERFAGWPIKVRHLSRFVSPKEATATRAELASGECDVVIGTHALLSRQVEFKRLGMVVVDEEQRFGVKHKERLKEMKADVHVLTLSATPIPRTLQLALTGIRDLSIIATPPVDRLAVRTYVVEFDPVTIREALLRERYRGGQTYFVAPRVSDLPHLERFLREQVPEVSYIAAHGQMSVTDLENAMTSFYEGKADVLLSTTIVESGLDIPRANTLVIHRADMFGLAQLYQLRGRVGRAKLRAYAYLTTADDEQLTEGAEKRLKVLQSLDSLGAGFMLASHDLDMRGGGNLLGEEQSGHIREVGVELYQQMLEDAVKALRSGEAAEVADDWSPQIDIGAAVLIPQAYVEDLSTRMSLYRRLADLTSDEDRESFAAELIDRFGPLPDETRQLLDITGVKILCKRLGVAKVSAGPKGALLAFRQDAPIDGDSLVAYVQKRPNVLKLRPDAKLVASGAWPDAQQRLVSVRNLLKDLSEFVLKR
ncbi:MAG: transcription-repair coupling factor [Alphaproteobacteria bacterium]|nr:transcription-repair coupling factor [Alphaproteobacteria bacterium]